jgi:hypothetical protein
MPGHLRLEPQVSFLLFYFVLLFLTNLIYFNLLIDLISIPCTRQATRMAVTGLTNVLWAIGEFFKSFLYNLSNILGAFTYKLRPVPAPGGVFTGPKRRQSLFGL